MSTQTLPELAADARKGRLEAFWTAYRAGFSGASGYLGLSRPGSDSSRTHPLV